MKTGPRNKDMRQSQTTTPMAKMRVAHAVLLGALLSSSSESSAATSHATLLPPLRWSARLARGVVIALRGGAGGVSGKPLNLSFSVVCDSTSLGEHIGVVGECEELGQWKNAVLMTALEV